MELRAIIPLKIGSIRLPSKNFLSLTGDDNDPPLWLVPYDLLFRAGIKVEAFTFREEEARTVFMQQARKWSPDYIDSHLLLENVDYPFSNSLGGTIAKCIEHISKTTGLKADYIIVPQSEVLPKTFNDLLKMVKFAEDNPNVDYIVSTKYGKQCGMWRIIKLPLNQEPLGQTIGMVDMDSVIIDIHTDNDYRICKDFYKNEKKNKPGKPWWLL